MKRKHTLAEVLVVDYSAAREQAIRWLGDRYLLARPINASNYSSPRVMLDSKPADISRAPASS